MRIEIGRRFYLPYLLLAHPVKVALLSPQSRRRLDAINHAFNETIYSGAGATDYDRIHRYDEAAQHDYPVRTYLSECWPAGGYGDALDLGAGSGYFTTVIAGRARSVLAVEPVPDMQAALAVRLAEGRIDNVRVVGVKAFELARVVPDASIDSAFIIQSLHHFHRRDEIFRQLGRVVRPGGQLFVVEPHHNVRRVVGLLRSYLAEYRAPAFWQDERNWATHDFCTRGELRALCRAGGFDRVTFRSHWFPLARRAVPDPRRRFRLEGLAGCLPLLRHFAGVLAMTARRRPAAAG